MRNLKWSGNREAQRQADAAYGKCRPKIKKTEDVRAMDYYTYIKSKAWRKKRKKFIRMSGGQCRCGSRRSLQVHHKHYRTLKRERFEDVEVVCKHCHEHIHERDGVLLTDELNQEFRSIIG